MRVGLLVLIFEPFAGFNTHRHTYFMLVVITKPLEERCEGEK